MKGKLLTFLDRKLYEFLEKHVDVMPLRFTKMIAFYYCDARTRKLYFRKLGITMGENTYANLGLKVVRNDGDFSVTVGSNVSIAPNVVFVCESTANNGREINTLPYVRDVMTGGGNITVGDEVWIGANVTVLQGVTIGKCSMIGAGSVVIHDVEPFSLYVGVPARKIRDLRTGERVTTG